MAEFVVSASKGVMNPLLDKLATLMGDEYKQPKRVRKDVRFLRDELSTMNALLERMDDADELDSLAKNWRKHVTAMSYDIEDCVDDFMHSVREDDGKVGILQKAFRCLRTYKDRYRIAKQIQEIKDRVVEASERRQRYKLDEFISIPTTVPVDPRLSALYNESTNLVGIDGQKQDLVKWVTDEEEQQLKVMSIVGFGGSGKTTLANAVYREEGGRFNYKAFVSVSQKPDMTRLLNIVRSKLKLPPSSYPCEVQDLIDNLRGYLQDKRYFIVVDDLWDVRAWNIISCAFPRNNQYSRVIVTTRIEGVARACCSDHGSIHIMKPLSDPDSRKLFFNRIFGSEDACPSQLINVSSEILKKCGGLPLAIITVASILACQPTRIKEQWEYIKNSLAAHSAINPTLEDMMHILDLSYKNLPRYLKACFLYLGLYPEDREISRNELVRAWVAEGIVSCPPLQDKWDVAKSYFNILVNRSMIQPTYYEYTNKVVLCRVHDMMLDLIISKCSEDKFSIVVRDPHALTEVQNKIRRLCVDLSGAEDDTIMSVTTTSYLSQVRSLAIFGASKWMPPLSDFKFLRVLFLEFPKRVARIDLTGIIHLPHLRYLKVECYALFKDGLELRIVLPSQIRRLRRLETLELPCTSVCTIPSDMFDLPCLSHLVVPPGTRFPDRIGKVKSLRTLDCYSLHKNSPENTRGLGELTNLADLTLYCRKEHRETMLRCTDDDDTSEATWMGALSSFLQKLGNLKQLSILSVIRTCNCDDALSSSFCPPFCNLEHLNLYGWTFSRVPRWISHLQNLRILRLGVKLKVTTTSRSTCWEEDVGIIGRLPSLVQLWLRIPGVLTERVVISGPTGFMVLEEFRIYCDGISFLTFEAGAMPNLQELLLGFDPQEWDKATPAGLQHLSSLKKIQVESEHQDPKEHATIIYNNAGSEGTCDNYMSAAELIKGIFQEAAGALPSCPAFTAGYTFRPVEWDS